MKRAHAGYEFQSEYVEDRPDGWGGFDLYRIEQGKGKRDRVARIIFWDAIGQFAIETFGEVPLTIVEELIDETKKSIKTK